MIYLKLLWTFFRIGLFTFGGGYAMLPLIQQAVEEQGWISSAELINFIAVSESTPGPFAVNMATYVGVEVGSATAGFWGGIFGALCATAGVVLPSFIIILLVARAFDKFKENKIVKGCMSGLKPAVIGLIGAAIISVGKTVFFPAEISVSVFGSAQFWFSLAVFAIMAVCAFKKLHPIIIICVSAVLGIAAGFVFGF